MSESKIAVKTDSNGEKIFYSVVEKESGSRLSFNKRILVLVDQKQLGYISKGDAQNIAAEIKVKNIKTKVALADIRRITPKDNLLTLLVKDKAKTFTWVFRMPSPRLAAEWTEILEKQNSPFPSRTPTEHQKNEQDQPQISKNPSSRELARETGKEKPPSAPTRGDPILQKEASRVSQKPFSFQAENDRDQSEFPLSPEKNDEQSFSLARKEKLFEEESLSEKLEKQVNLSIVESELHAFRQNKLNNKMSRETQFKQLSSIIGRRKDIYSLNFCNYFRVPAAVVDDEKYRDFYELCKQLTEDLIKNGGEISRELWAEQIRVGNGLEVLVLESELKKIPGDSHVCNEGLLKTHLNEVKNLNYLWKAIANDHALNQLFLIPMSCVIEYQGAIFSFSADFESPPKKSAHQDADYSEHFERLCEICMISKHVLEDSKAIRISPFGASQFVISQATCYLPKLTSLSTQIRPELFSSMASEGKLPQPYLTRKGKKEQDQQAKLFVASIEDSIRILSANLNKLEEYVIHPQEFSALMHSYGLNMSMMKEIYERIDNMFAREILKTEVAVRSFKMIFRKKMQDTQAQDISKNRDRAKLARGMLNVLLGNNDEAHTMWKIVTLHSQLHFELAVEQQEVNKGYLVMGLQHHLGLLINFSYDSCSKVFEVPNFVSSVEFRFKIKMCELFWLDELEELEKSEAAETLINNFELRHKNFPFFITQDPRMHNALLDILSLYHGPNSAFASLGLYQLHTDCTHLTLQYHRRKMTEVKWLIKESRISLREVEMKLEELQQPLRFYFGINHMFYTEVCDLLVAVNEQARNYPQALEYCRKSIANSIKLCGGNNMHVKLAGNYYQMGETLQLWCRLDESVAQFKKAKNILEFNGYTTDREYALILLRLAGLYLVKYKDHECFKLLFSAIEILLKKGVEANLQEIVEGLLLLNRCDPDLPLRTQTLMKHVSAIMSICLAQNYLSDELFIKLLKISVECFFRQHSREIGPELWLFLECLSDKISHSHAQKHHSLQTTQEYFRNQLFEKTMEGFSSKCQIWMQAQRKNSLLSRASHADHFEQLMGSLLVVLGEGFLLGVIEPSNRR